MKMRELIDAYKAHRYSPYRKLEHKSRKDADYLMGRIASEWSEKKIPAIKAETLIVQYERWSSDGQHVDMAHSLVTMLRRLFGFGFTFLEDPACDRLVRVMGELKFKRGNPRTQRITTDQAIAIRAAAHRAGRPSVALAQAIMFDFGWRQKDTIGAYEPRGKQGDESDVVVAQWGQWLRGVRWEEIGRDLVVHHVTSKKKKLSQPPILYAPMVLEELKLAYPEFETLHRAALPKRGPVIVNERTGWPYSEDQFRTLWRKIATAAGVPKDVQSRDSRAGMATDALRKNVPMHRVRQMLGHSKIETTAIYARDQAGETAEGMKQRAEYSQ